MRMRSPRLNFCIELDGLDIVGIEVYSTQTMGGAPFYAETALGTLFIINGGKVVNDGDGTLGTYLFTLTASDTSVGTIFTGDGALFMVATKD